MCRYAEGHFYFTHQVRSHFLISYIKAPSLSPLCMSFPFWLTYLLALFSFCSSLHHSFLCSHIYTLLSLSKTSPAFSLKHSHTFFFYQVSLCSHKPTHISHTHTHTHKRNINNFLFSPLSVSLSPSLCVSLYQTPTFKSFLCFSNHFSV